MTSARTNITVRLLEQRDAALVLSADPDCFDNPPRLALVQEFLADPRHHLVAALDGGRLIGFASGVHYVHPDKPAQMFIDEVGVVVSHAGRGIGTRLVQALLAHGRTLGCSEAWVLAEDDNTAARRLYAAAGGTQVASPAMFTFDLSTEIPLTERA